MRRSVKMAAAAARRSASDDDAGVRVSSGNRKPGSANRLSATSQRYICSFGSGAKYAASEYASFSFHLLTKLSWQALHFRLMPRKTWAVFCDACIHGVTAALVSPRQFTPTRNPSGSAGVLRIEQPRDELIVRQVALQRREQPVADALAAGGLREVGHAVFVAQQIVPERHPVLGVLLIVGEQRRRRAPRVCRVRDRRESAAVVLVSAADPRRRGTRGARTSRRKRAPARALSRAARYFATSRSSGASQSARSPRAPPAVVNASGASQGCGAARGGWRPPRALIDPPANQRDLARRQRILVLRHLRLDRSGQPVDHECFARRCRV